MQNRNKLKLHIVLALLAAISILMGKYLAVSGGDIMRFSLENTPVILAGMAFGPLAGAAVGALADLVGCLMVGYTINPVVTIGAASVGAMAGLGTLFCKHLGISGPVQTVVSVMGAHIIGSIIIKTAGLAAYYLMPYSVVMLWRILNYSIVGVIDGLIVHLLLNHRGIEMQIKELKKK